VNIGLQGYSALLRNVNTPLLCSPTTLAVVDPEDLFCSKRLQSCYEGVFNAEFTISFIAVLIVMLVTVLMAEQKNSHAFLALGNTITQKD
jgi:hypothetical protein